MSIREAVEMRHNQNPQYDYLWRVELPSLQFGMDTASDATLRRYVERYLTPPSFGPKEAKEVSYRVYEISTPYHTFDTRKSVDGVSFRYAVAHHDIGSISMTIDEMEDGKTLQYFEQWRRLMTNIGGPSAGSRNPPQVYKRDIRFIRMSGAKSDLHYSIYRNYFPTEISPLQNSYEGNGITQFSVTFTGDDVEHRFIDQATINSKLSEYERAILDASYKRQGIQFGGIDEMTVSKVADRVFDMF